MRLVWFCLFKSVRTCTNRGQSCSSHPLWWVYFWLSWRFFPSSLVYPWHCHSFERLSFVFFVWPCSAHWWVTSSAPRVVDFWIERALRTSSSSRGWFRKGEVLQPYSQCIFAPGSFSSFLYLLITIMINLLTLLPHILHATAYSSMPKTMEKLFHAKQSIKTPKWYSHWWKANG